MRERLDRLSPEGRHLLLLASVLGSSFDAEQLAAMLDRRPSQLVEAVEEVTRADILSTDGRRLQFRHELLREAVLDTLGISIRRALLREAATVLLESGAQPVEVATQLAESAERGDTLAIATLRAASKTMAASDGGTAAELALRALDLTEIDDPERTSLVAESLVLLHASLRHDEARELASTALKTGLSGEAEAEIRLSLSGDVHAAQPG